MGASWSFCLSCVLHAQSAGRRPVDRAFERLRLRRSNVQQAPMPHAEPSARRTAKQTAGTKAEQGTCVTRGLQCTSAFLSHRNACNAVILSTCSQGPAFSFESRAVWQVPFLHRAPSCSLLAGSLLSCTSDNDGSH
jgi:hypothetical protein